MSIAFTIVLAFNYAGLSYLTANEIFETEDVSAKEQFIAYGFTFFFLPMLYAAMVFLALRTYVDKTLH